MNKMQEAINALENVIQAIDDAYKRGYEEKRTWQGLTDDEALECWPGLAMYADCAKFWENIEAKLKEKNNAT